MEAAPEAPTTPQRLLLATDLGARCDRALDRAAQLAVEWRAELVALNVLDPAAARDQALARARGIGEDALVEVARRQLARDLRAVEASVKLLVRSNGDAAAEIRARADALPADLVVTGVARDETLGRFLLGSTVENLARALSQPLLVVKHRPHEAYHHIVVATDFSASSGHALRTAARFFPARKLVLYHSLAQPSADDLDRARPSTGGACVDDPKCAAFLAATALPAGTRLSLVVEHDALETGLSRYVRTHDVDLVVTGSRVLGRLAALLQGSTASRLLDWLPCDVLLVREPIATR